MSHRVRATTASKHRALVVGADGEARTSWIAALRTAGIDVVSESDVEQALCIAAELRPDALVIDLEIPRCDPLQLMRCLREHPRTARALVVALADSMSRDAIAFARARGADVVLARGAKPHAIASVIVSLVERRHARAA